MVVIGEILAEDLTLVFVAPNLHRYLSPSDKASLGEERPEQKNIVLSHPYGNPGLVRATHPQEIAAWYIQSVGDENATCDSCRARNESSRAHPFFVRCISYGDIQRGACGNCAMSHRAADCSERK